MPYGDGTGPLWSRGSGYRGFGANGFRGFGRGLRLCRFWYNPSGLPAAASPETEKEILVREQQLLKERLAFIQERLGKE